MIGKEVSDLGHDVGNRGMLPRSGGARWILIGQVVLILGSPHQHVHSCSTVLVLFHGNQRGDQLGSRRRKSRYATKVGWG